jgi:hypothetical protein
MEVSERLQQLATGIHEQQKSIVGAVLVILLFLVAPRTDELLRQGTDELKRLDPKAAKAKAEASLNSADNTLETLWATLQKSTIFTGSPPTKMTSEDLAALGMQAPETLAELVAFAEGRSRRCEPQPDHDVIAGLAVLKEDARLIVREMRLHAVREPEAQAAARAVLNAARQAKQRVAGIATLAKVPTAVANAPIAAPNLALPPPPPKEIVVVEHDRFVRKPNTAAYEAWTKTVSKLQQARTRAAQQRELTDAAQEAAQAAWELSKDAATQLDGEMRSLQHAVDMQLSADGGPPRYVVLELALGAGSRFGSTSVHVPMTCKQMALATEHERRGVVGPPDSDSPILQHLRASEHWETLSAAPLAMAVPSGNQALLKGEQTLNVFGFDVHERLLTRVAPWLLAALLVWHVMHIARFRRCLQEGAEHASFTAAAMLPTIPNRRNFVLPLVTAGAAITISVMLLRRAEGDVVASVAGVLVIVSAIASVVLTLSIPSQAVRLGLPLQ